MDNKLERFLNYFVGVILFLNLYYFSIYIFLPNSVLLVGSLLVSGFYFFKHFNSRQWLSQSSTWFVLSFYLFSVFYWIIDIVWYGSAANFNDLIRITIYLLYFSWTLMAYSSKGKLIQYILRMSFISLGILIAEGFLEIQNPVLFFLMKKDVVGKFTTRIGGTFLDSNNYSSALILFLTVIFWFYRPASKVKQTVVYLVATVLVAYLVDVSGSRQGLLMLFILLFYFAYDKYKRNFIYVFTGTIVVSALIGLVFRNAIVTYAYKSPESSVSRLILYDENRNSTASNEERVLSFVAGLEFAKSNFYILGSGSIVFNERYANLNSTAVAIPHNGFFFLYTQYGAFMLVFIYFFYLIFQRALKTKALLFFLYMLLLFGFLGNVCYYSLFFFLLFILDFMYLLPEDMVIPENIEPAT